MYVLLLVTVSVLQTLSHVTTPCPTRCACYDASVYCEKLSLSALPGGIANTTEELFMTRNRLEALSNDTFDQLIYLKNLDVSNNRISLVEMAAFHLLSQLSDLDLSYNNISILHPDMFPATLKDLSLSWNPLIIPQDTPFLNIPGLESLFLYDCNITQLPDLVFRGTPNISYLNIRRNLIESVNVEIFRGLSKLRMLRLSENRITAINSDTFQYNSQLIDLTLMKNNISQIDFNVFKGNPKLEALHISENPLQVSEDPQPVNLTHLAEFKLKRCGLTRMPVSMMRAAPNLESLTLSKNSIRHVDVAMLDGFSHLNYVDLKDNPVACDCRYRQVWDWAYRRGIAILGVCYEELIKCTNGIERN